MTRFVAFPIPPTSRLTSDLVSAAAQWSDDARNLEISRIEYRSFAMDLLTYFDKAVTCFSFYQWQSRKNRSVHRR